MTISIHTSQHSGTLLRIPAIYPDAATTIDIFLKHLDRRLLAKILDWETKPANMAGWEEVARVEYKQAHKKAVTVCCNHRNTNGIPLCHNEIAREEINTLTKTPDPMSPWI